MGIASSKTKLPLATWAKVLGVHPLHFEQIAYTPANRNAAVCDGGFVQYDWQTADQVSREQIAQAIAEAEEMIERYTGYRVAPAWEEEEWHRTERPFRPELVNLGGKAIPWYNSSVPANWKRVISGGVEARTLIQAGRPIVWSDEDGDGDADTGTVTAVVGDNQAPCEVEIFYPGHAGLAQYQIRPTTVVVSGGVATITFKRQLAVAESIFERFSPAPDTNWAARWTEDGDFLDEVDVYRHWNDPSTQATLMWEPSGCLGCGGGGCSACAYAVQTGCLHLRSTPDVGQLAWTPAEWNSEAGDFDYVGLALGHAPDLIRLHYYAGHQSPDGCPLDMDPAWARAVTYLSLTLLDRPACQCTSDVWDYWRELPGRISEGNVVLSTAALDNPFGMMRGALHAWNRVNDRRTSIAQFASI